MTMTSTGQVPEPWRTTAATLFNPYLNVHQRSNVTRQRSARSRASASTQQGRVPPESLVNAGYPKVTSSESQKRPRSKHFPSSHATDDVAIYVQQMIHYSPEPTHRASSDERLKGTSASKRIPLSRQQTGVSDFGLEDFFAATSIQMSRMATKLLTRESTFHEHPEQSSKSRSTKRRGLTLADMCNIASNVGDKMSQSREKTGHEIIRGFRLPSARLTYESHEHFPTDPSVLLGQPVASDRIRLSDVLTDDNFSKEAMVEFVDANEADDRLSRTSRSQAKSATSAVSKIVELKDWRGKITQGNLPDVRNHSRRLRAESVESPQRPCTAASNLSKSRPESADELGNEDQTDEETKITSTKSEETRTRPLGSALKKPSSSSQRQRNYPLNVRIHENNSSTDNIQHINHEETDSPIKHTADSIGSRHSHEPKENPANLLDLVVRPSSESIMSTRATPLALLTRDDQRRESRSPDPTSTKPTYKLIRSSTSHIYRTIPESTENGSTVASRTGPSFSQLSLPQLELLGNYDPSIAVKIGAPFLPVQMLARPRDAQLSLRRSTEQIERDYPKKNGQPVFELPSARSTHNLIDVAQVLQSNKSKRIPVERQTTFERPENEPPVEETLQIIPIENPNQLAIELYTPPKEHSTMKPASPAKMSTKQHSTLSDYLSNVDKPSTIIESPKDDDRMEANLSVINMRTQQEVDQVRPRKKLEQKRLTFTKPAHSTSPRQRNAKQHGRPIPSVFLTEDPDEVDYATSVYRHSKNEVDVKRVFKGHVGGNLQRKLSADERKQREDRQRAAIKIQRAYREHLQRRDDIESRRPDSARQRERERRHRQVLSAKRAQFVEKKLNEEIRIREGNKQMKKLVSDTGPSVEIFGKFNQVEAQFSKATLDRAATCIQRWWRGFIIRHRAAALKAEVASLGATWSEFLTHYRDVIRRVQRMRQSDHPQFLFSRAQAKDFLTTEKKLTTIYNTMSFNDKLDDTELAHFFDCCDLSATTNEIDEGLQAVLGYYGQKKSEPLSKEMVFDVVYFIYPPLGTGLKSTRQSTWVRPIIDGEDESAIQGTPFLEPIDIDVINRMLGKPK